MRTLYRNMTVVNLELLKSRLDGAGIGCCIQNEFPPAAGSIPPISAWPTLCILDNAQFEAAEKILHDWLDERATSSKKAWLCPNCHTKVDRELAICWKCGQSKS